MIFWTVNNSDLMEVIIVLGDNFIWMQCGLVFAPRISVYLINVVYGAEERCLFNESHQT